MQLEYSEAQLEKWNVAEAKIRCRLQEALEQKHILVVEDVLSMATRLPCLSDGFKVYVDRCQTERNVWKKSIRTILMDSGLPPDFVQRYIERICDKIDDLPQVRWSEIRNIGIDNPVVAKIVARKTKVSQQKLVRTSQVGKKTKVAPRTKKKTKIWK